MKDIDIAEKVDTVEIVRKSYDESVEKEWGRLERHKIEFEITKRYLRRYIKPGSKILDVGGGPGRYSLFLAEMGCDVMLADLSQNNVDFALERAVEQSLSIRGICADARELINIGAIKGESFDYILLMGPMYHLLEEADRIKTVDGCMKLLKANGVIFVSFISSYAGIIYSMKYEPQLILDPTCKDHYRLFEEDKEFVGESFTQAYFIRHSDVLPFMSQFALEKLHFLGQESLISPCEPNILAQPPEVIERWLDLAEKVCEREDLLTFSEHYLYVGRKT